MPQAQIRSVKPKRRRRLRPKQVVRIRHMLMPDDDGNDPKYTVSQMAEVLQLDYMTVYSIHRGYTYKDAGGPIKPDARRTNALTPERRDRIRVLRSKGAKIAALAKATGLSESTIKRICKEDS